MAQPPIAAARISRMQAGATKLQVAEYGDAGPPLVLIHGIGSRGVSWWPVIDQLAHEFRLIVPDLRGHGGSDKPGSGYLIPDYANDLGALIDVFGIRRPLIVGHSLGGIIAWQWASANPRRAAGIVIEDSPLHGGDDVLPLFESWIELASLTPDEAAARYHLEHPDWTREECERRAESITSTHLGVFKELRAEQVGGEDRFGRIAAIDTPMLLIRGDESAGGMVTAGDAARFLDIAQHGSVAQIPTGSHSLHRDFTDQFLALALPFLRSAT